MTITSLSLQNFKGWRKAQLPLGRITVSFGTNSSGKTSILQSLLLLKQTAESYDRSRVLNFGDREKDLIEYHISSIDNEQLEELSHYTTERAAKGLAKKHGLAAAKIYSALGMCILKKGKSKYYK